MLIEKCHITAEIKAAVSVSGPLPPIHRTARPLSFSRQLSLPLSFLQSSDLNPAEHLWGNLKNESQSFCDIT